MDRTAAGGDLRPVLASGVLRALLLPLAAVLNVAETAVIAGAVGIGTVGAVLLVGNLFQLLPFADLGVGAALTRAVAAAEGDPATDPHVAAVLRRSLRVLALSATALVAGAVALGASGLWPRLLGLDGQIASPDLVATLTIVLFALSLPFALGPRVLMGLNKNHVVVATSVLQPVLALLLALAVRATAGGRAPTCSSSRWPCWPR